LFAALSEPAGESTCEVTPGAIAIFVTLVLNADRP
jgi:hypothetical protein